MFQQPDHQHNLSLRLSQVLDEIGVNQEIVTKRRRTWMLNETINHIERYLTDHEISSHYFGSQIEGSSTLGLNPDIDNLLCLNEVLVIQDWSEWQQGKAQYLMIQDDTTYPGYCLLQALDRNVPLPIQDIQHEHFSIDNSGRVLLRHSYCLGQILDGSIRHGPAASDHSGPGRADSDLVAALQCSSWPKEANSWLQQRSASGWPTDDMKKYSAEQNCFLVPVCGRTGIYQEVEWRISTSFAERCLMWNINITQMRCYILMKMIIKTFLQPRCEEAVSSFMCKSIIFHCIADSETSISWNESTLLSKLNLCLQVLFNCILTEKCSHFILPRNNLLAGKLNVEIKRQLVDVMCILTGNIEQSLLGISIDELGNRLRVKSGGMSVVYLKSASYIAINIAVQNTSLIVRRLVLGLKYVMKSISHHPVTIYQISFSNIVFKLCQFYCIGSRLEKAAINLLTPFFCTFIGSVMASVDIQHSQGISHAAMLWFSLGLKSDISSSRLKLASALYCVGDLERCEIILRTLANQMSQTFVFNKCCCYVQEETYSDNFGKLCYEINEKAIQKNIPICVRYFPCEVYCIPKEMKYEMFRSTEEDRSYRGKYDDWMDWAVVDSLPYLHFLQYKVYNQLQRPDDKVRALYNLAHAIISDDNLGHKDTALNLLGQCMEQENRTEDALYCYTLSLNVRARNNAAIWHVCKLLARLFRS